jgi:hypothetical protein
MNRFRLKYGMALRLSLSKTPVGNIFERKDAEFAPKAPYIHIIAMATKAPYQTTFEPEHTIQPIYTGGSVALNQTGHILATTLSEDALLTDFTTGRQLAKIEGVWSHKENGLDCVSADYLCRMEKSFRLSPVCFNYPSFCCNC